MDDNRCYAVGVRVPEPDEVVGWRVVNEAGEVVQWGGPVVAEMTAETRLRVGVDHGSD